MQYDFQWIESTPSFNLIQLISGVLDDPQQTIPHTYLEFSITTKTKKKTVTQLHVNKREKIKKK